LLGQLDGVTSQSNAQVQLATASEALTLLGDDADPRLAAGLIETVADATYLVDPTQLARAVSMYERLLTRCDPADGASCGRLGQKMGQAMLWAPDPSPQWRAVAIEVLEDAAASCTPNIDSYLAALIRRTLFEAYDADGLRDHADSAVSVGEELIALGAASPSNLILLSDLYVLTEHPSAISRGIGILRSLDDESLAADPDLWLRRRLVLIHGLIATGKHGELDEAIALGEEALKTVEQDELSLAALALRSALVDGYAKRAGSGDAERALDHANSAYEQSAQVGDPDIRAELATQVGYAFIGGIGFDRVRAVEEAISWYERALESADVVTTPALWGRIQHNLGEAYRQRVGGSGSSNVAKAIECFDRALEIHTRSALPVKWAETTNSLALTYFGSIDDPERGRETAQALLREVVEAGDEVSDPHVRRVVRNSYALTLARIEGGGEEAIEIIRQLTTETELEPQLLATLRVNLASLEWGAGMIEASESDYRAAVRASDDVADPSVRLDAMDGLASVLLDQGRWEEAADVSAEAERHGLRHLQAAVVPKSRRLIVRSVARANARLTWALMRQGRFADALLALDRGRARLLTDAVDIRAAAQRLDETRRGAFDAARRAVRETEAELAAPPDAPTRRSDAELYELLKNNRRWLNALIEKVQQEDPTAFHRELSLDDILQCVPERGAIVATSIGDQGGVVFVLPHGISRVVDQHVLELPLITTEWVQTLLWRDASASGDGSPPGWWLSYLGRSVDQARWDDALIRTIADCGQVMSPIAARLRELGIEEGAPVVLLLPGSLAGLPVHAAPVSDGRPFADLHPVSSAPCARVLERRSDTGADRESTRARIIANPTGDLPFAAAEGAAVAEVFTECELIEGSEATLSTVGRAMERFSHWHFACHAAHDLTDPAHSSIVLSDRRLTGDLLISFPSAPIIVLSGCETGLVDILDTPDEFAGLQTEFLYAGAKSVVSSLWPVNDESTMLLMQRFYRVHLSGESTVAAMREAASWLRAAPAGELADCLKPYRATSPEARTAWRALVTRPPDETPYSHPKHWAAMVVTGA
jgi:tetratricopeptide (TPR) repeat protein